MSKTVKEIVESVDAIKPNGFTPAQKTVWLNELEGRVQTEVLLLARPEVIAYDWEEDKEKRVLAEPPYDNIYELYLSARIDFANGEYRKYENTMEAFNAAMGAFIRWFAGRYRPADGYRRENAWTAAG